MSERRYKNSAWFELDLETRKIISPVEEVKDYEKGSYLTYRYSRSVRFRINQIRGPNAAVSAIFFDEVK